MWLRCGGRAALCTAIGSQSTVGDRLYPHLSICAKDFIPSQTRLTFSTTAGQGGKMEGLSKALQDKIAAMEGVMGEDHGNRGVGPLAEVSRGGLLDAALHLYSSHSVGIITGFYITACSAPETDGPLGAMAIARALVGMKKDVAIITDGWCEGMMSAAQTAAVPSAGEDHERGKICLIVYPKQEGEEKNAGDGDEAEYSKRGQDWAMQLLKKHPFDHFVSIERVGPAVDGRCYNMRGMDITPYTAPLHSIFTTATAMGISTTGIGDGGNEIGMGKVVELVKEHVPHGATIGCSVATHNLLVTGVSNWGGYALAGALYLLHKEKHGDADVSWLPSRETETRLLDAILEAGAVDGAMRKASRSVDGIAFDKYLEQLDRILQLAS